MHKTIMKHWNSLRLNYYIRKMKKKKTKKKKITLILPANSMEYGACSMEHWAWIFVKIPIRNEMQTKFNICGICV